MTLGDYDIMMDENFVNPFYNVYCPRCFCFCFLYMIFEISVCSKKNATQVFRFINKNPWFIIKTAITRWIQFFFAKWNRETFANTKF